MILLIGMAVGVDYSLFYIAANARSAQRPRRPRRDRGAAATSGRAVLICGITVITAMAGMFLSGDKTFISFADRHDRSSSPSRWSAR